MDYKIIFCSRLFLPSGQRQLRVVHVSHYYQSIIVVLQYTTYPSSISKANHTFQCAFKNCSLVLFEQSRKKMESASTEEIIVIFPLLNWVSDDFQFEHPSLTELNSIEL